MKLTERKTNSLLRQHGYKLTPQRRAVIQVVTSSNDHLTPNDIYEKLRENYSGTGLVTIYRTLDILAELGLICEVHSGGNCRSYTLCSQQHHHHLICSGCGIVVDFTGHYLDGLEKNLSEESGFRIDGHLLEFIGLCRQCQAA
ncbi:MAG: transcriptional repressor [Dehalococcoidales bacterium]|nr:MAG: transcriptional repressor [Dehalococcoidales bacterium]